MSRHRRDLIILPRRRMTPANNYVGSVGDSLTVAGGDMNGTVRTFNTSGTVGSFFTWAMALPVTGGGNAGKPIWAGCSGGSGEGVATIYSSRWPSLRDALPKRGFVVFMAGTNDLGNMASNGIGSYLEIYTRMIRECMANGQVPVICAVPPAGTSGAVTTPEARSAAVVPWNAALKELARQLGLPFADCFTPVGNAANGAWADSSYVNTDGTHPSSIGALLMAPPLRDAIEPWLQNEYPKLVTTGDDTTGWKWIGGRFTADANVNNRPDGGFIASVTDVWNAPNNSGAFELASEAGVVDGNWLTINKTGTDASSSSSTTSATGNAPLNTTTSDLYVTSFKFKTAGLTGAINDRGPHLLLADSGGAGNFVFSLVTWGIPADGGPYGLSILGRNPPTASTYRWTYNYNCRGSGGQGRVSIAQLSVRQIA